MRVADAMAQLRARGAWSLIEDVIRGPIPYASRAEPPPSPTDYLGSTGTEEVYRWHHVGGRKIWGRSTMMDDMETRALSEERGE